MSKQSSQKLTGITSNLYVYNVQNQFVQTFDVESLKKKLRANDSLPSFDDQIISKADRNIPALHQKKKQLKKNKDQCYYYKKLLAYEKNMQRSIQLRQLKKAQRQEGYDYKLTTKASKEMLDLQKVIEPKYKNSKSDRKHPAFLRNHRSALTAEKKGENFTLEDIQREKVRYKTITQKNSISSQANKNKVKYTNKIEDYRLFDNSMPLKMEQKLEKIKDIDLLRDSRQEIRIEPAQNTVLNRKPQKNEKARQKKKDKGSQTLIQIKESTTEIGKSIQKLKQQSIQKKMEYQISFEEWKAKFKTKKSKSVLPQPQPKPKREFTVRTFNWKKEPLHKMFNSLNVEEFESFIKIYQNVGPIKEINFGCYKAYVGPGNNNQIIKRILKERRCWAIVNSIQDKPNFVWTQNIHFKYSSSFTKRNKEELLNAFLQKCKYPQIEVYEDLIGKQKDVEKFVTLKKNNFIESCQKILSPDSFFQYTKILSQKFKAGESTKMLRRVEEFIFESGDKIDKKELESLAAEIKVHNHVLENYQISNKKCLFTNLTKFCELIGESTDKILPKTYHIDNSWNPKSFSNENYGQGPWILKPGEFTNRGQGITIHINQQSLLNQIEKNRKTSRNYERGQTNIIQQYIDPLLYQGRKFDIRVWVLWSRGQAWWYQQGYVRTSCKQFTLRNTNKFVHLTNDAIQSQCSEYGKYQPANKVSFAQLHKYLQKVHNYPDFYTKIMTQMKRITTKVFQMSSFLFNKNYVTEEIEKQFDFQLFGLDFLIDRNMKVWLIQCNNNPCLQTNCSLLSRLIPNLIDNVFQLTIDSYFPASPKKKSKQPKDQIPWNHQTFRFQLLYSYKGKNSLKENDRLSRQLKEFISSQKEEQPNLLQEVQSQFSSYECTIEE